jgi:hypothetical protein
MLDTIHEYGRARLAEDAESIVLWIAMLGITPR